MGYFDEYWLLRCNAVHFMARSLNRCTNLKLDHPLSADYDRLFNICMDGTIIFGMLFESSVKPGHWFVTLIVQWQLNKLFRIPPEEPSRRNYPVNSLSILYSHNYRHSINIVTGSLFTFVTIPLLDCLTAQLYTPNLLTLSHRIQLHLIRSNWSTEWHLAHSNWLSL
jgi:hypothetical protein